MAVSLRRHSPKLITSCRRFFRTPNTHITPPQPFSLYDQLLQTQAPLLINMPIVCPKNGVCRPDSCQPSPPPLNLLTLFIDLTWFFPPVVAFVLRSCLNDPHRLRSPCSPSLHDSKTSTVGILMIDIKRYASANFNALF